jgi:hypothetical protein
MRLACDMKRYICCAFMIIQEITGCQGISFSQMSFFAFPQKGTLQFVQLADLFLISKKLLQNNVS